MTKNLNVRALIPRFSDGIVAIDVSMGLRAGYSGLRVLRGLSRASEGSQGLVMVLRCRRLLL